MISATKIGTIVHRDGGHRVSLFIGRNSNTDEIIVWVQHDGLRANRVTGRNLSKLVDDLEFLLNEGQASWSGEPNHFALDYLIGSVRS